MTDRASKHLYFRPVRSLRLAFFLLLLLAACDTDLPIEPEEIVFGEAEIVVSRDSLTSRSQIFNFDPTFIGRESLREIKIEYRDTIELGLHIATSDTMFGPSSVFKVAGDEQITFTKKTTQKTIKLIFTPNHPITTELGYLILKRYVWTDTLHTTADTLGVHYFRLTGVEQSFYLDLEMVFIPGETFVMGLDSATAVTDTADLDEIGEHTVILSDFFIGRYEVTNIQYYEFWIEDKTRKPPQLDTLKMGKWDVVALDKPNFPVVGVSWYDAMDFCRWLSLRTGEHYTLPTEAQWEYAATGGTRQKWPWSASKESEEEGEDNEPINFADLANTRMSGDGYTYTAPVDAFQAGASAFGIYNMAGNVWEWCLDWYHKDYYKFFLDTPVDDPQGPDDPEHRLFKVIRGGSWLDDLKEARCSNRGALDPRNKEINVGFRVVKLP